jgi:serine/threonine-protein kinase
VPGQPLRTVMCIEVRPDQQDILREYFTKHGYRVLVLADLERGLARLEMNPPDCMVIMADAMGSAALDGYYRAQELAPGSRCGVILILGEAQSEWKEGLRETQHARVLVKPVTLRELRAAVKACVNGELPPE